MASLILSTNKMENPFKIGDKIVYEKGTKYEEFGLVTRFEYAWNDGICKQDIKIYAIYPSSINGEQFVWFSADSIQLAENSVDFETMLREYVEQHNSYIAFREGHIDEQIQNIKDWYASKHNKESEEIEAAKKLLEDNGYKVS